MTKSSSTLYFYMGTLFSVAVVVASLALQSSYGTGVGILLMLMNIIGIVTTGFK